MIKYLKLFITTGLFSFILQACGSSSTKKTAALGLGSSFSMTDNNGSIDASKSTLENIGKEVAEVLKTEISALNQKEATEFINETDLCDIAGRKTSTTKGSYEQIFSSKSYESCEDGKYMQDGEIEMEYNEMNDDGQYPNKVSLSIANNYLFNSTQLKQNFKIDSTISYKENKEISSIILTINGELNYQNANYELQNIEQVVNY